jgi:predicted RNase H-like nuclease (RuvC/YqgF family)
MELPWDIITNAIVASFTGFIGFLTGRERNKKETESVVIQNVENAIAIYKTMLDDIVKRYDSEISFLKEKIISYEKHITSLENKLKNITKK